MLTVCWLVAGGLALYFVRGELAQTVRRPKPPGR